MNRQGKKSSLTTKTVSVSPKSKAKVNSTNRGLSNTKGRFKAKSAKKIKAEKNSAFKRSLNSIKKTSDRKSHSPHKAKKSSPWIVAAYAITIAVGLSTILGTVASIVSSFDTPTENATTAATVSSPRQNDRQLDNLFAISSLGREIPTLKSRLQQLASKYPDLDPELFFVDLDTKGFVSIKGDVAIASASTIKLPILVVFFQEVDRGKISLEEQLVMTKDVIAGGSGGMQYEKPGTTFSALQTAEKMMTTSDNTATNMIVKRLGGMEKLNQHFQKYDLAGTRLRNPLPDLAGTNTTSPEDLGNLLVKIDRGKLISLRSRDRLLYIMRNIVRNTLLPEGIESDAIVAHKTGDIKSVLGDVGIVDMPNGKRYIASLLVKRPDNSPQAKEFIQEASRVAYQYFKNAPTSSFTLDEE